MSTDLDKLEALARADDTMHVALVPRTILELINRVRAAEARADRAETRAARAWRTDAPHHGVRCLVTIDDDGKRCVYAATYDTGDEEWFLDNLPSRYGRHVRGVIAWTPAPEPAEVAKP